MLYSLTETVSRFRPRSGINKVRYLGSNYINYANPNMHQQPRFYLSSKDDKFKYWTSYKTEWDASQNVLATRGVSSLSPGLGSNPGYPIQDVAPFIVYNKSIPTNKIVIKSLPDR